MAQKEHPGSFYPINLNPWISQRANSELLTEWMTQRWSSSYGILRLSWAYDLSCGRSSFSTPHPNTAFLTLLTTLWATTHEDLGLVGEGTLLTSSCRVPYWLRT